CDGKARQTGKTVTSTEGEGSGAYLARPFWLSQSLATWAGSALSVTTLATSCSRPGVSSLALTALRASATVLLSALALASTGTTASFGTMFLSSVSEVKPLAVMLGSVEKRLAQLTVLSFSAATVTGPAVSSGLNSLNLAL